MNFKKKVNGSWVKTPHYIHNTSTDTITTLPAVLYPNDTTATVGLKGNMVQTSTPSPSSPVMPEGCGERTGNLAPPLLEWVNGYVASNGMIAGSSETYKEKSSDYILIDAGKAYTFSMENGFPGGTDYSWRAIGWYTQDKTFISRASGNANVALSTNSPSNAVYCRLSYRTHGEETNPMLNLGSTALPYEPYGYKIPISSVNTTTPVYLGEIESTRRVKKLVLTGEENFSYDATYTRFTLPIPNARFTSNRSDETPCTHYISIHDGRSIDNVPDDSIYVTAGGGYVYINIKDTTYTSLADFKAYLAQQYAAGTPVTVWYVLATEETGTINEPLMKIGNYADEVSGVSIPVTAGGDTISVDTTLQPSEVTVNYKGWHPVQNVHERNNGAWT